MQSVLRKAARACLARPPIASSSTSSAPTTAVRTLATHLSEPTFSPASFNPFASPTTSPSSSSPSVSNPYIVPSPQPQPKAPRHSAKSSRERGRGANNPSKALSVGKDQGEIKIFLPSVFMRLVRNTAEYAGDPYTATFRTDLRLTKPDITNYLKNVYGLEVTSIRTMNYVSKTRRNPIGGGYSRAGGVKNYKKVLVGLKEPFWYPAERSSVWANEHFQRDGMEEMRDRKMLRIGDGQKYGVGSPRYRGAHKSKAEVERLAAAVSEGGHVDTEAPSDGKTSMKKPIGLRKKTNVVRSRAERLASENELLQKEVERLKAEGW